jgi:hypothetical protein
MSVIPEFVDLKMHDSSQLKKAIDDESDWISQGFLGASGSFIFLSKM